MLQNMRSAQDGPHREWPGPHVTGVRLIPWTVGDPLRNSIVQQSEKPVSVIVEKRQVCVRPQGVACLANC